jgi:hypothetical protein
MSSELMKALVDVKKLLDVEMERADAAEAQVGLLRKEKHDLLQDHSDLLGERDPLIKARDTLQLELRRLREGIGALVEKWLSEQHDYPDTIEGRHAAAAVRLCAQELAALTTEEN